MTDYKTLLRSKAYIDGAWIDAKNGRVFNVTNPATGAVIGSVPLMDGADTRRAVECAHAAFPAWKGLLAHDRAKILRRWAGLIVENVDNLAALLTAEQGKPLAEARGEILGGAGFVDWYAEEARRIYGDTIPTHKADARIIVTKEPVGVVGAITPWNFPSSMITRKLAPAFAVGCTAVLKPAEDTPLSALALAALAAEAGFPKGVFNIVTTDAAGAPDVGRVLTTHPLVRKISFTGSTEVGKILIAQSATTVKRVSMELGGNAPFIVFDSADLDRAVDGALASKYRNAGQTCICANRIYVQSGIHDAFVEKLTQRVAALKIGPGDLDGVQIGPMINQAAIDKVRAHIADAVSKGASLIHGGDLDRAGPLFFTPTVLSGMTTDMRMHAEEIFGPVAGIFRFDAEANVIAMANDTAFGLASYFYTRDLGQAIRVSEALEYGMVAVNESMLAYEGAPFGGIKESGMGREGSKYGVEDFLSLKYTLLGGV